MASEARSLLGPPSAHEGALVRSNAKVWWLHPAGFLALVTLPTFVVSYLLGGPIMQMYGALNFLTPQVLLVGLGCILVCSAGALLAANVPTASVFYQARFNVARSDTALYVLLTVSLVAHIALMMAVIMQPGLVINALMGVRGSSSVLKESLGRIPGLTTLTQLYLIGVPLYVAYHRLFGKRPPRGIQRIFWALMVFVVFRAFFGIERLALIEVAVCATVPYIAFRARWSRVYTYYPIFGIVGAFALFALAEYFRSWPAYKNIYDSYGQFISLRFLGYLATSTNNAAGVFSAFGAMHEPWFTATWLRKIPIISNYVNLGDNSLKLFFAKFGNEEFNNPSGIFAPVLDFGVGVGLCIWFVIGYVGGALYRMFSKGYPAGVLFYPSYFMGFLLLTQVFLWGDPRYFPVIIVALPMLLYVTARERSGASSLSSRSSVL